MIVCSLSIRMINIIYVFFSRYKIYFIEKKNIYIINFNFINNLLLINKQNSIYLILYYNDLDYSVPKNNFLILKFKRMY